MPNSLRSGESKIGDSAALAKPLRRSSRQTVPTAVVKTREVSTETASTGSLSEPRRNPKRKAAEAARESIDLPDNLLDEALRPLTPADIEEWEGWVELESEPVSSPLLLLLLIIKMEGINPTQHHYITFYNLLISFRHSSTLFFRIWVSKMSKFKNFSALIKAG